MASGYGSDFVDRVRAAVDMVALISETVALKRAGRKFRGLCPFHPEKTPSFHVDDAKGLFYCFGCQAGGDIFKFVMLRENLDFPQAARLLAQKSGIPVPAPRGPDGRPSEREALLAAHRAAAEFFHDLLVKRPEGAAARDYLAARGITGDTIARLQIGYAPDRWDSLKGHLTGKGFDTRLLVTGGLLSTNDERTSTYDRFRGRVIFPIRGVTGEVLGFGGRILGAVEPKYLNSAETPLYNKRENLFGLHETRQAIRDAGEAIVVEGYFDYASLWQAGVPHVVATLGTAFAEEQVALLRRFAGKVVINYDPDAAGASATRRSIELLVSAGLKVRVLRLDGGLDPDEYVRQRGLDDYMARVQAAPRHFDYLLGQAIRGKDLSDYEQKAAALREVIPALAQVPDRIERAGYVNSIAEKLGIDDDLTLAEIRDGVLKTPRPRPADARRSAGPAPAAELSESEARLIRGLLESAEIRNDVLARLGSEDLAGSAIEELFRAVEGLSEAGEDVSWTRLSEVLREPARSLVARLAVRSDPGISRDEALRCVESLRLRRLRRERDLLQKEMEHELSAARLDELLRRKMEVSRQIDSLS